MDYLCPPLPSSGGCVHYMSYCYCADIPASERGPTYTPLLGGYRKNLDEIFY